MGKGPIDKMKLHEFRILCTDAMLVSDIFPMREIYMCFRQAMMTEIDEILEKDHLEMIYVEFIEAITRVAELTCLKANKNKTLDKKLEFIFTQLINVCPDSIATSFKVPTEETFFQMKYVQKLVTKQVLSGCN